VCIVSIYIRLAIEDLGEKYNIRKIAFTVVPFGQGFKDMSPPTKELMRAFYLSGQCKP
jgi:hypothetical protein